jgi:hypothetical protein
MSDYLVAAPIPPDGRLQVWALDSTATKLLTRWKITSDPNSQWSAPWGPLDPQPPSLPFYDMTAGVLSDGRTQIWGVDGSGVVYTTWKVSTAHDSPWTNWSTFDTTGISAAGIAVAALPDKRLQLFIVDGALKTYSAWKTTTASNSPWTSFTPF